MSSDSDELYRSYESEQYSNQSFFFSFSFFFFLGAKYLLEISKEIPKSFVSLKIWMDL